MARPRPARERQAGGPAASQVGWDCPADRWAWAQAIYQGISGFQLGLDGIADDDGNRRRGTYAAVTDGESLGNALTRSEDFMDKYFDTERDYYLSRDCDDQWKEWCQEKAKDERLSKEQLRQLIADSNARWMWAGDQFDAPCAWSQIREDCHDLDFIYYVLKEHPVVVVRLNADQVWQRLVDIVAFCPDCNVPLDDTDVGQGVAGGDEEDLAHRYDPNCQACSVTVRTCAFDERGCARPYLECWYCAALIFFKDDLDGERARPLTWPPMLSYPPRRNFAGGPDGAPPWEVDDT